MQHRFDPGGTKACGDPAGQLRQWRLVQHDGPSGTRHGLGDPVGQLPSDDHVIGVVGLHAHGRGGGLLVQAQQCQGLADGVSGRPAVAVDDMGGDLCVERLALGEDLPVTISRVRARFGGEHRTGRRPGGAAYALLNRHP